MTKTIQDRVDYLKKCADLYETNGSSPLSDFEYDKEYEELKKLDPKNQFFKSVGGLDEGQIFGETVAHEVMMGSLHKSANIDDFEKWLRNTYGDRENDFISYRLSFVLQYKIDGLSLSCLYKNGNLVQCLTRGDGKKGVNVFSNCMYISDIPKTIECFDDVEIRGEIYKDREGFQNDWVGIYANERNFAAGSLNQKNPKITGERGLSFIAYEVVRKSFSRETDKMHFLQSNGFKTVISSSKTNICGNFKHIVACVKDFMDSIDRKGLQFGIDGVVVKLDQINVAKEMGSTDEGRRPKSNRAVKFACEQKEATLKSVEWGIGRTGNLTCVGILDPVELAGTTVSRVTLHNPRFIQEFDLKIGCKLLIQKSGDIIPYIVQKISDGDAEIEIPTICPSCKGKLEWNDNRVTKICSNYNCSSQATQRIDKWFKVLGVNGIGEGIIARILPLRSYTDSRIIVTSISDMYKLYRSTDVLIEEFGPKAADNILASIASVKEVSLDVFVEALGISKIGSMAKEVVKISPTIEDIDKLEIKDLLKIDGFSEIKAMCFVDGWQKARKEVDKLLECVSIKKKEYDSMRLTGKSFCFTGSFSNPTRKEMEAMVEANGGRLGGVSKNLTALVSDGEMMGSKMEKAKKMGVPVITQKDFLKMLGG